MTIRFTLIMAAFTLAAPLSAQTTPTPAVSPGMEIQVRHAGDTTWTTARAGGISGQNRDCAMVKLVPTDPATGDFFLTSFKAFTGVRVRDAGGQWREISAAELTALQHCTPG